MRHICDEGMAENSRLTRRARRPSGWIAKPARRTVASVSQFGWQPPAMRVHAD
jgi:hypothetical protein